MKHEFDVFYEPPAEVRPHKQVNYTIKVIGGPDEYKEYLKKKEARLRREHAAKQEAYLARRIILEGIMLGEVAASPQAQAAAERAKEIAQAYASSKKRMHFKVTSVEQPPPPPSLFSRVKKWMLG